MSLKFTLPAVALLSMSLIGCGKTEDKPAELSLGGPGCTDNSRACLESIAKGYIDALLAHDGKGLPLDPTVRRTENALTNAKGPTEVAESFARTHMVKDARDIRFYTDTERGEVVAFFRGDIDLAKEDALATTKAGDTEYKVAVSVPAGTYTVHEAERFKIVKGKITEIEIIAHVEDGKGAGSGWPVERDAAMKAGEKAPEVQPKK